MDFKSPRNLPFLLDFFGVEINSFLSRRQVRCVAFLVVPGTRQEIMEAHSFVKMTSQFWLSRGQYQKGMERRLICHDDKYCVDVVRDEAISQIIKWGMGS